MNAITATDPDADLPGRGHASGVAMAKLYLGLMARIIPVWAFFALAVMAILLTFGMAMAPGIDAATHVANLLDATSVVARPVVAIMAVVLLAVPAIIYAAGYAFGQRMLMTTGVGED